MKIYKYGPQQEGHFIPRAMVTFEHFKGCFIVIQSKIGLSNYFGSSSVWSKKENKLESFTKTWGVKYDPNDEDWKTLAEIFDRPIPEDNRRYLNNEGLLDSMGWRAYTSSKQDLFYAERDKDIEAYITSKLGWE